MKTKNKNILVIFLGIIPLLFSSCSSQKTNVSTPINGSSNSVNNSTNSQNNAPTTRTRAS